ncbi:MAG: hypothetical protein LC118_17995 [Dehalococcoidia bacterium]|nr:hypothetical protein [Dehalococcoidia bacterium]
MAMLDGLGARLDTFRGMDAAATQAVVESLVWITIAEPENDAHAHLLGVSLVSLPGLQELSDDERAARVATAMQRLDALEASELWWHLQALGRDLGEPERRVIVLAIASVVATAGGALGETRKLLLSRMGEAFEVTPEALERTIQALAAAV